MIRMRFTWKLGLCTLLITALAAAPQLTAPATAAQAQTREAALQTTAPTSERINQLVETAMHYYWHGGDIKQAEKEFFKGVTLRGKYDVVEQAFKEATLLDPYNKDLKFSLASTQIIQKKVPEALATYRQIINLDPEDFNAHLLYGIYSHVNGDETSYIRSIAELERLDPVQAEAWVKRIQKAESIMRTPFRTSVPYGMSDESLAIVILGYALADDGSMQEPLIERLKQGLAAARAYPNAKVIVTGGVPKQGITEAEAMKKWLVDRGVDPKRIIMEDKSTDTVENALFANAILEQEDIRLVILVTSASHMRRALTLFQEASALHARLNGTPANRMFFNLVYLDYKTLEEAHQVKQEEKLVIFRDLTRVSGIWAYPGIQR